MQVGEFEVKSVTVGEGLDLLSMIDSEDMSSFQKALILKAVTKDGESIEALDFKELLPHMAELVSAAMELNGFKENE